MFDHVPLEEEELDNLDNCKHKNIQIEFKEIRGHTIKVRVLLITHGKHNIQIFSSDGAASN